MFNREARREKKAMRVAMQEEMFRQQMAAHEAGQLARDYVAKNQMRATTALLTPTGNLFLFPDRIVRVRKSEVPDMQMLDGVTASLDSDGALSARTTLTRAATVGDGWQKSIDTRQVFLTVEGDTFAWVLDVTPGNMLRATQLTNIRNFVGAVNLASRQHLRTAG